MTGCTMTGSDKDSLAATPNKVCHSFLVYWLVLLSASIFCLGFLSNGTAAILYSVCHLSFHSLQLDKQKPISVYISPQSMFNSTTDRKSKTLYCSLNRIGISFFFLVSKSNDRLCHYTLSVSICFECNAVNAPLYESTNYIMGGTRRQGHMI